MRYRSIDLFAGIGGIRLGFDQAFAEQIQTVFISEFDQWANKTYEANFGTDVPIAGDITKIEAEEIPEFDICLAGFPCQAFSIAGHHKGFEDDYRGMTRGTLFMDVVRICGHHKPKVIFCENVKGLVQHDRGRTFKVIKGAFEELGYTVFHQVLNSKDFGVPQNRERIYIVCFRNDIAPEAFEFPTEPPAGFEPLKTIADIRESPREHDARLEVSNTVINSAERERESISRPPYRLIESKYWLSQRYLDTLETHRARHASKGNGFGYVIREDNEVAGALVCGGMGRERNLLWDFNLNGRASTTNIKGEINREGVRKMTPREWARLQGFPDDFELPLADTHLYKQLGNSVTVPVIKAIALKIKEALEAKGAHGDE